MATTNLGRVVPKYLGDYSADETYKQNHLVRYGTAIYWHYGIEPTTGISPTDDTVWRVAVQDAEGAVVSFNGRTGVVIPQSGDYTAADVGADEVGTAVSIVDSLNVSSPESSEITSTTFIDTVSQTNGLVFATKKTLPSASTSTKGIVQLSSSTSSDSVILAATASAVKAAYDHGGVTSVNGSAGAVTLDATDVGALPDTTVVPEVIDNVTSTSQVDALSANQGKSLNDRINNISTRGRFLSLWNCVTGLPLTNPSGYPYEYHTGDFFIVNNTGETNYIPDGLSYVGEASTTVYTGGIKINDTIFFDGTSWMVFDTPAGSCDVQDVYVNGSSVLSAGIAYVVVPDELADLTGDTTHRTVTDTEKSTWNAKQSALVSGTNIKTINNQSVLGSGNLVVSGMPDVTTADNGKFARVNSSGVWVAESVPSAENSTF